MAACGADASRISNRSAGDAACEGGIVGDDGEDGPQGCVWACPAAADGMVPAGARQIDWIAGDPGFGLTPKKYQSGEKDITGGITRAGDEMVRAALYEAANVLLSRITRFSKLKRWGMDVAKRRGLKRAKVALARKIGVILHRIWVDGTTYRWTEAKPIATQA